MPSKPGAIVTVLYRRTSDLTFNTAYYISTHIPLFTEKWRPYGLLDVTLCEATADSEFAYTVVTEWKDAEGFSTALKDEQESKTIMDDVPNFTNGAPSFVIGKILSKNTAEKI